jgi:hypothetical protein
MRHRRMRCGSWRIFDSLVVKTRNPLGQFGQRVFCCLSGPHRGQARLPHWTALPCLVAIKCESWLVGATRIFLTSLSGCPSELASLTFASRCQFSDRDCKPAEIMFGAHKRRYNRGAFHGHRFNGGCAGETFGSAGKLLPRSCRPAHSCHPSSASDAGSSYLEGALP